ncbi:hypothetical protein SAMN05216410_2457 [Sanguibacter gelidistatuariae]|uniref:Uncharacterized protein n=1 Tax=Sanguibacter gelidistatuariae TaxID=1814289 RepID=A0A1G6Q6R8_9MICO|nr:DUF5979 domain-containing protein [Sanguibacter gelidistatuariae]SDC88018.1 hypothetical protein SAMN05216410_2457 [Sanguibacter gelidistatuariae]
MSRLRRATAALVAVLLAAIAVVSLPVASQATELDAVTGVTITTSGDPITQYQKLKIDATWAVPDAAVAGDTFSLAFPTDPKLSGFVDTFDLKDPTGAVVATCTVAPAGFECTLSSYVNDRKNVSGTLSFYASFTETSTNEEVTFVAGSSATIVVAIPGGVGEVGEGTFEPITTPTKWGWVADGTAETVWQIYLPSKDVVGQDGTPITLTDTIDPRLIPDMTTFTIDFVLDSEWNGGDWGNNVVRLAADASDGYALTEGPTANQFQVKINYTPEATGTFIIQYWAPLPTERVNGDTYANTIAGSEAWSTNGTAFYQGASGDGNGDMVRSLALTKKVDGIAPAGSFAFSVDCTVDGTSLATFPRTLTLAADEVAYIQSIPVGSVCVITETDNLGATSVTYSDSDTVTVTADSPALIQVTATNHFVVPPVKVGALAVTKAVTGDGVVPAGTEYAVDYSYVLDGNTVTGTLPVLAGATATLEDLPVGTVVTLTEPVIPAVTGAAWGAPAFTIAGATATPTPSIDVTIAADSTVAVNLTNTTTRVPDVELGSIAVTKSVTGPAASLVPADTAYAVAYSYTLDGQVVTGTLPVLAGATATIEDLPVGTVVTLTEPVIPAVTNVQWGSPTFTVASATTPTSAAVTVSAGATAVAVTNTAARTPVVGVLSTSGTAPTGAYTLPSSGGLAMTGASPLAALLTAAGLAIAGIAMVSSRRTRSER